MSLKRLTYHKNVHKKSIAGHFFEKRTDESGESELELILGHIPMAVYWKDSDLIYRGSNPQFRAISQIKKEDFIGKTDADFHIKEAAEMFRQEDMLFLSGEKTETYFKDKIVPMNDREIWARTYKIPIYDEHHKIKYIMGLIQDVTKIKLDEIALAESEHRMRTVLNATDDRIAFVDSSEKMLMANDSFIRDFITPATNNRKSHRRNTSAEESKSKKRLKELLDPMFYHKIQEGINESGVTGEHISFDFQIEGRQAVKYYDVSIYPVLSDNGSMGTAIFAKDITKHKDIEERLLNASNSKSEFLSRMSHEIRTPLNAIIGMAKIAEMTEDPHKIKDCVQKIDSSSKHLLGLINDILDMSKIEANKLVLSDEVFNFEKTMMDVVNVVTVQADEKRQKLLVEIDSAVPRYFCADALRLRQVVTNLLSNSIKFTPEYGEIGLAAELKEIKGGVAVIKIVISDTGIGISQEQQERLFQPFEQADGGISRKFGGTGLGLVICKAIIEMMGGHIHIESELGKGSRFVFDLKMKLHDKEQAEALGESGFSGGASNHVPNLARHRILIAEDIEINREIAAALLEPTKVKIDFATTGKEAADIFNAAKEVYSLILMDIHMPEMDGYEATRLIRANSDAKSRTIPIVAMTADAFKEDIDRCKEVGMNDHISKPIDEKDLYKKIQICLEGVLE